MVVGVACMRTVPSMESINRVEPRQLIFDDVLILGDSELTDSETDSDIEPG